MANLMRLFHTAILIGVLKSPSLVAGINSCCGSDALHAVEARCDFMVVDEDSDGSVVDGDATGGDATAAVVADFVEQLLIDSVREACRQVQEAR